MDDVAARSMVLGEFLPLVGRDFEVDATPATISIRLTEASPLAPTGYPGRPPFILVFRSEPQARLLTGTYTLRAPGFGPDLIHISEMIPPPGAEAGYYYQAIFN